ncbi:MAG TPA: CpaD family pilus assembly protein [Rhizomicrobium sp.]|jgi:pilus assembly protein CpaD
MTTKDILRLASLAAVLMAGSCASPYNDGSGLMNDGAANHPIVVEPTNKSVLVNFAGTDAGLSPQDDARVNQFVMGYMTRGNGAISVSVPRGPGSSATVTWFGEHLVEMGVSRSHILIGEHDGPGVQLDFIEYTAHTDECGDWSVNAGDTASNLPMPNFGCATQHNIAVQVADPRDLVAPRTMDQADAKRRAAIVDKYEKGTPTAAEKSNEQSANVADVSK